MSNNTGIHRRLPIKVTESLRSRFWSRVDRGRDDECWNWTAGFRNGYGAIKHQGRVLSTHRVAYVLSFGEPDDGLVIAHKCDNRACCNPAHLEAATPAKNVRDSYARGDPQTAKGVECPGAKLHDAAVAEIWVLHRRGVSARKIAISYGVDRKTIGDIIAGRTWKHLIPSWAKA